MIPHLETSDVQLNGPPEPFEAVMRQAPVLELAPNEKTERFLVHSASCAGGHPGRAQTPTDVSPRKDLKT